MLGIYAPGLVDLLDILQGKAVVERWRCTVDRRAYCPDDGRGPRLAGQVRRDPGRLEDDLLAGMTEPEKLARRALIKRVDLRPKP